MPNIVDGLEVRRTLKMSCPAKNYATEFLAGEIGSLPNFGSTIFKQWAASPTSEPSFDRAGAQRVGNFLR